MTTILTVIQQFNTYNVGDDITDADTVTAVLAATPQFVVKTNAVRNTTPTPPSPPVTSGALTAATPTTPVTPPGAKTFYLELTGSGQTTGQLEYLLADGATYAPAAVATDGSAPVVLDKIAYNGSVQNGVRIAVRVDQATTKIRFNPATVTGTVNYAFTGLS